MLGTLSPIQQAVSKQVLEGKSPGILPRSWVGGAHVREGGDQEKPGHITVPHPNTMLAE